jgi:hypothetical protein
MSFTWISLRFGRPFLPNQKQVYREATLDRADAVIGDEIMQNELKLRVRLMRITLFLITFVSSILLGIFIYFFTIIPRYDISHDPPINGYCIGDQIVDHRECINPTCLDGYNLDYGTCVESKPYSNLVPYIGAFLVFIILGGIFCSILILLILFICIIEPPTQSDPESLPVYSETSR